MTLYCGYLSSHDPFDVKISPTLNIITVNNEFNLSFQDYFPEKYFIYFSKKRGQSWRRDAKCDCKIDWLWVRYPLEEGKYLFTFIFSFLRSGVEAIARR